VYVRRFSVRPASCGSDRLHMIIRGDDLQNIDPLAKAGLMLVASLNPRRVTIGPDFIECAGSAVWRPDPRCPSCPFAGRLANGTPLPMLILLSARTP
jgi:hypothetical protein